MIDLKEDAPINTDINIDEEILEMKSLSKYTKTYNSEKRPKQNSINQRFHKAIKNFLKKHFPNDGRFHPHADNIDEYKAQVKNNEVIIRTSIFDDPYNLDFKKCVEIKINLQNYSFAVTKTAMFDNYNNVKAFLDFNEEPDLTASIEYNGEKFLSLQDFAIVMGVSKYVAAKIINSGEIKDYGSTKITMLKIEDVKNYIKKLKNGK